MRGLRALAGAGALLYAAGWAAGWYVRVSELTPGAREVVVRPDAVLVRGLAWVALVPLLLAPFVSFDRRRLAWAWPAALPALALVAVASARLPRAAVLDETIGDAVRERVLGQGLSLAGALIVVIALVAAWRRAPDWRFVEAWSATPERPDVTTS